MGLPRSRILQRTGPRAALVLLLCTVLATAGCLAFLQPSASKDGGSPGSGADGGGSGGGGGAPSSADGSAGGNGSTPSAPARWTPYDLVDGTTYRFDVQAAGQGSGELAWSVDAVSAGTVTSTVSLTLAGTTTSRQVQGPPNTIPSGLALTPIWDVLQKSLYDPVLEAVGGHDLVPGGAYTVQTPGGAVTVTVVGTKTLATGTCTEVQVANTAGTVLDACVDPSHGFPLEVVTYDPTTGAQLVQLTLTAYHAP